MSDSKLRQLLSECNSDNLKDPNWITSLQEAINDAGLTNNREYCLRHGLGETDGSLGGNTRKDIIEFLEKNPTF